MKTVWTIFNAIIMLGLLGLGVYGFVLFIKFLNRAIKALNIYIAEKTND